MKKFEANREHLEFAELPNFKHKVPIVYFDPIVKNDETVILLYCGGLGATISYARMLNYDITNNNFFAFFERAGAGNNRNKTSRFPKYFVNEIKEVVAYLKRQIPNTKIFIIGESWGAALATLYFKKYSDTVSGIIIWNMPLNIKDASHTPWLHRINIGLKMLLTIPFGIPTYDRKVRDTSETLSSNALLVRLTKIANANQVNDNKISVAAWWSFKPAWHWLKQQLENDTLNFMYVQSGEDFMMNKNFIDTIFKKHTTKHLKFIDKGYHVLICEEQCNDELFLVIRETIKTATTKLT